MKRNPLSRTTEPAPPDNTPPSTRRRRVIIFCVVGFFAWPTIVFALANINEGRFPEDWGAIAYIVLVCVSSLVWLFSSYVLYDTLFQMAEARWPAAKLIRQFLNLIFQVLRAFGPRH
jgi:hypothetical protein